MLRKRYMLRTVAHCSEGCGIQPRARRKKAQI